MRVSILVTNFGKAHLFKQSLPSILPQLEPDDEIVVCDDGPQDGINDLLKTLPVRWKYWRTDNDKYRSGCKAKNITVKLASHEVCIISDPEVWHVTHCIDQIRDYLSKNKRQFIVPGSMYFAKTMAQEPKDFDLSKAWGYIPKSQAPFIGGVMKQELYAIGGWDERFKFWGNDDNDLMHRLGKNGCHHVVDNDMVALHQWHSRPPAEAMGDTNESLLYEKDKPIVANQGVEWGKI